MAELKTVPKIDDPKAKLEQETAPKRRGRPPGSKNNTSRNSRATSLEPQIGQLLTTINFVVMMVPPLRADALDPDETIALARAIDAQCRTSPRFRKYVEMMLTAGSGGQLIMVIGMIAMRRAARHGMMPSELDAMVGNMMASENAKGPVSPFNVTQPEPEPVAEQPTPAAA